jgi:hypothetical protein
MPKQRDGPAPQETTPGQGQKRTRAPPLPQPESPRKSGRTPSQHRRSRRRQPQGWREFRVRVCLPPTSDSVHAMHSYLKTMARKFGLEIADIDEVRDHEKNR